MHQGSHWVRVFVVECGLKRLLESADEKDDALVVFSMEILAKRTDACGDVGERSRLIANELEGAPFLPCKNVVVEEVLVIAINLQQGGQNIPTRETLGRK